MVVVVVVVVVVAVVLFVLVPVMILMIMIVLFYAIVGANTHPFLNECEMHLKCPCTCHMKMPWHLKPIHLRMPHSVPVNHGCTWHF